MPDEARYHGALAKVLSKNPHWVREAMEQLDHCIRLKPNDPGPHYEMARLYLAQGLKNRARRSIDVAQRLAPGHPEIKRLAAEIGPANPGDTTDPGSGLLDRFRRKP